jgi:cytosine/adenosine deaminase-related metal-dependent hydrolase
MQARPAKGKPYLTSSSCILAVVTVPTIINAHTHFSDSAGRRRGLRIEADLSKPQMKI